MVKDRALAVTIAEGERAMGKGMNQRKEKKKPKGGKKT